jgi:predicted nucleic acid-binding Zn ribbon protein
MAQRKDRPRGPVAVAEALQGYLSRAGLAGRVAQAQVVPDWPARVGAAIAAVTRPEGVAPDGTLFVRVATSAWMTELQLMAPEILAKLNAGRRAGRVKTIRWLLATERF